MTSNEPTVGIPQPPAPVWRSVGNRNRVRFEAKQALMAMLETLDLPLGARAIPLTRGKFTLVDEADYAFLMQWQWYARTGGDDAFYATRGAYEPLVDGKRKKCAIQMHNVLMAPPPGMEVDHINSDPLDNRRSNLRICTHRQNMFNIRRQKQSRSEHKGVYWHIHRKAWTAFIFIDGKGKYLGVFDEERDAALAYNAAAQKHYGEYAKLNRVKAQ